MPNRHLAGSPPHKKFTMPELSLSDSGVWTVPASGNYRVEIIAGGGYVGSGSGRTSYQARTYDDNYCLAFSFNFPNNEAAAWNWCVNQYTTYYNEGRGGSAGGAGEYKAIELRLKKGQTVEYAVGGAGQNSSFGGTHATAGGNGGYGNMWNRYGGTGGYANSARPWGKGGDGGAGEAQGGVGRTDGAAGGAGAIFVNFVGR